MRLLPYPVTVVTAAYGKRFRGITIGSFTSLSLQPPLVTFNVNCESQMHSLLEDADRFVVHIPGEDQDEICSRFALPDQEDAEQFEGLNYTREPGEPPVLSDVIAELHCTMFRMFRAGDHSIIIGSVERIQRNREEPSILYCNGAYQALKLDSSG